MAHKLPIYLELARDIQTAVRPQPGALQPLTLHSDKASLDAAIADTLEFMHNSSSGAILLGHLIHREGLQDEMVKLLKRTDYPAATMLIGKADYLEHLPECMGTYQGGGSPVAVKERVEGSDIVLSLALPNQILISVDSVPISTTSKWCAPPATMFTCRTNIIRRCD